MKIDNTINIKKGNNDIAKVYKGDNLIWQRVAPSLEFSDPLSVTVTTNSSSQIENTGSFTSTVNNNLNAATTGMKITGSYFARGSYGVNPRSNTTMQFYLISTTGVVLNLPEMVIQPGSNTTVAATSTGIDFEYIIERVGSNFVYKVKRYTLSYTNSAGTQFSSTETDRGSDLTLSVNFILKDLAVRVTNVNAALNRTYRADVSNIKIEYY